MSLPSGLPIASGWARLVDLKSALVLLLNLPPPRSGDGRFALDPELQYVLGAGHDSQLRLVDHAQPTGELLRRHRRTQRHRECRYATAEVSDVQRPVSYTHLTL